MDRVIQTYEGVVAMARALSNALPRRPGGLVCSRVRLSCDAIFPVRCLMMSLPTACTGLWPRAPQNQGLRPVQAARSGYSAEALVRPCACCVAPKQMGCMADGPRAMRQSLSFHRRWRRRARPPLSVAASRRFSALAPSPSLAFSHRCCPHFIRMVRLTFRLQVDLGG